LESERAKKKTTMKKKEEEKVKKKYYYIGMTNNKLDEYENEINKKNSNQIGGSMEQINDKDFFRKLSELSGSINLSVDELVKILKTKYDPDSDAPEGNPNVITLVTEGLGKLDTINNSVQNINNEVIAIRDEIAPRPQPEIILGPNNTGFKIDSKEGPYNSGTEYPNGNMGHRPPVKGGYFPVPPVDSEQDMRSEYLKSLKEVGIKVEKHHHEVAPSQHELGMYFGTLTNQADNMQLYK
jgi:hypothetical protein